ncbi:MAG: McrC family protein [Ruminococcus flavefaciens]|nr:McrC family protein [Ruminococcus flavefaciens]
MNAYEYGTTLNQQNLPKSWLTSLEELQTFLQKSWEQRNLLYTDSNKSETQQFLKFTEPNSIKTNGYIGTIIFKGHQLNIYPRVFKKSITDTNADNNSQKHLLHCISKWIEYSSQDKKLPFLNLSVGLDYADNLRELFITLYVRYLKGIISRGIYYQYVDESEDCRSIKGRFNLCNYITKKIPSGQYDKFKCEYSKFNYDNLINRIIKYTCVQLLKNTSQNNQKNLRIILAKLNEVSDVKCTPRDCDMVRLDKSHKDYNIIINMSKMFLINQVSDFTKDNNDSFCFLFHTQDLFEDFIGWNIKEILNEKNIKVNLQKSDKYLIDKVIYKDQSFRKVFQMKHDIYFEYQGKVIILDTKYKELERFENCTDIRKCISKEVKQSDCYQMISYATKRDCKDIYLLYPMYRHESIEPCFPVAVIELPEGEVINLHLIRLPYVFEESDSGEKLISELREVVERELL